MSLEKAKIEGAIFDVITEEEYLQNPNAIDRRHTAIKGNDGYIYPIRNLTDNRPGYYPTGCVDFFIPPSPSEAVFYGTKNIINFKDATNIREVIETQQKLNAAERSILTTIDNVFEPDIGENDLPEMRALKQAIIDKHVDLDKYEQRIGANYNNDKRILKKGNITFDKLRTFCEALDIKATITLEDNNPEVPNPIGRVIVAELTSPNAAYIEGDDGVESKTTDS